MNRIILNYSQSCNLSCEFCYVSFHNKKIEDRSPEIIEVASELGFNVITFGGGDPFTKREFRRACHLAKIKGLLTHVDTSGLAIKESDLELIGDAIDILGISIDGIKEAHDLMRNSKGLFGKINTLLTVLKKIKTTIKINTVLTSQNSSELPKIFDYLSQFENIKIWSIYQFFPLDAALQKKSKYELSDEQFDISVSFLPEATGSFIVERFKYSERVTGYIFSDELGNLYTNDIEGQYKTIGSIFQKNISEILLNFHEKINPKTTHRY